MNLPPFYTGQQIIAIEDHKQGHFKKGDVFTVTGVYLGCCNKWWITIGIPQSAKNTRCVTCGTRTPNNTGQARFDSKRFAPILSNFKRISFTKCIENEPVSEN